MLKISDSIRDLDESDIGDNLLYYDYHIKHLLSLIKKGVDREDQAYQSSYRSFEGEVFENYIYEKLLRYVTTQDSVEKFILKGPHKKRSRALSNALSANWKGQIVYRTKRNEIGEFDAMIFTKKQLYFVEMTLTKNLGNLKKRLRKKKALLETLFPHYEVKALLILNEGVGGVKQLPPYASAWVTKPFSAENTLKWLLQNKKMRRKPFLRVKDKRNVNTANLKTRPFRYYNTLSWILSKIRTKKDVLNMDFLTSKTVSRYHDLFTKIYIGYITPGEFDLIFPTLGKTTDSNIIVALEKEHNNTFTLNYFMRYSRKDLDLITHKNGTLNVVKKDPYGVTVTEIAHMLKTMNASHELKKDDLEAVKRLICREDRLQGQSPED